MPWMRRECWWTTIEVRQPSLDDVFFSLTGGHIEEDEGESEAGVERRRHVRRTEAGTAGPNWKE